MPCRPAESTLYVSDRRWSLGLSADGDGVRLRATYANHDGGRLELVLRHLEAQPCAAARTVRLAATAATVIEIRTTGALDPDEGAAAGRDLLAQVLRGRVETTAAPLRARRRRLPSCG